MAVTFSGACNGHTAVWPRYRGEVVIPRRWCGGASRRDRGRLRRSGEATRQNYCDRNSPTTSLVKRRPSSVGRTRSPSRSSQPWA
ncbi:hypothetical protein [Lysobacter gummosus]|uniref:hypothetical protein n=1 Tax=Lysobacter gummosus TaxID=262324 RepID=UPI003640D5CD